MVAGRLERTSERGRGVWLYGGVDGLKFDGLVVERRTSAFEGRYFCASDPLSLASLFLAVYLDGGIVAKKTVVLNYEGNLTLR